jgi:hypothetical protein
MKKKVTVHDIKQALLDERFRAKLPAELSEDVQKFLKNPGCACNHPIYLRVMRKAPKEIAAYFPAMDEPDPEAMEKEIEKLMRNDFQVINCHINELVHELRKLGPGRKQIEAARHGDQITVIVNHLEGVY